MLNILAPEAAEAILQDEQLPDRPGLNYYLPTQTLVPMSTLIITLSTDYGHPEEA